MKWFMLGGDGEMYPLGECVDFNEADEKADDAVWIFDAITAQEWVETLTEYLD